MWSFLVCTVSHTTVLVTGHFTGWRLRTWHERVEVLCACKMAQQCEFVWFSIPCLIIVNQQFAFLTVAKHWAGVFIKLSVILHTLMSYLQRTHMHLSDHDQLRAYHFIWKGRIAPFPGMHCFIFTDVKHHLSSYSEAIQFCATHLRNWPIS